MAADNDLRRGLGLGVNPFYAFDREGKPQVRPVDHIDRIAPEQGQRAAMLMTPRCGSN